MTLHNCLYLTATVLAFIGWEIRVFADDDVTVISTTSSTTPATQKDVASDGMPVVHKSLHKKKQAAATTATASATTTPPAATSATTPSAQTSSSISTASAKTAPSSNPVHLVPSVSVGPTALVPTVETGLPVARYPGMGTPIKGVSTYIPTAVTLPPTKTVLGATTHETLFASTYPSSVAPLTSAAAGTFSSPSRTTTPSATFTFTNYNKKVKNTYPWKSGIITTMFYIGEGGSNISSTDNVASAWDENWRSTNRGSDNPNDRNGFASAEHASTVNPFYVALPFNDLAFPDKASEWVPRGWHRRPEDGKQVSACKDRWVWIKNANGRSCFAQWEDVGPLRYDHAEYVFGSERPIGMGDDHAGLDVSPAVWQYLGLSESKHATTSWRFVDDEDVPPGQWLKYDEQAVIFTALHQLKSSTPSSDLPIQRATEPIDDPSNIDSNKKKIDASKG